MRHLFGTLLIGLITTGCFGQEKKDLKISISHGYLTSPYYNQSKGGNFNAFDMDYYFRKKHILSSNFTSGSHMYIEDKISNIPPQSNNMGDRATYRTFSFLYKFKFIDEPRFSIAAGTGAGFMTHTRNYLYQDVNSTYYRSSGWTDLVFPVRLELDYIISNHFQAGIIGGFYIQPDYPFLGYHAGIRISYVLK